LGNLHPPGRNTLCYIDFNVQQWLAETGSQVDRLEEKMRKCRGKNATTLANKMLKKILMIVVLVCCLPVMASARTALVIGNGNYSSAPLDNPVHDASDIANKLRQLDFNVNILTDASRREMRRAIREYSETLRTSGGVGLFYYAGHGMQIKGVNYLIPTDAIMQNEFEIPDEAVAANSVLRALEEAGNDLNIVILDACRDNPFARSYRSAATRGLARMDAPGGSIIAYATAPGDVALDGDGRNGVYTKHLLANLDKPGMPIEQMFKKVRIGVIDDSGGQQTPWEESSLRSDFYFSPAQVMEVKLPQNNAETPTYTSKPVPVETATVQPATQLSVSTQPASELAQQQQDQPTAADLLAKAATAMNDYRLTTPEKNNALYFYRQTLKVDPVNFEAHNGLQKITQRYITLAEQEMRNKDPDNAKRFIVRGLTIQPDNYRLYQLKRQAEEMQIQAEMLSKQNQSSAAAVQVATQPQQAEVVQPIEQVAVVIPQSATAADANVEEAVLNPVPAADASGTLNETEKANEKVADANNATSHTQRMKIDIKRDVTEFKNSILNLGKSLKGGLGVLGGTAKKSKSRQNDK